MKKYVRSGIRTHAHRSGLRPERSALDLSAILTMSPFGDPETKSSNAVHSSHEAIHLQDQVQHISRLRPDPTVQRTFMHLHAAHLLSPRLQAYSFWD